MAVNILHQIVGRTRTGKTIICANEFENIPLVCDYFQNSCFTMDDLLDVDAVFEYLSIRASHRGDIFVEIYERHLFAIRGMLPFEDYESAKFRAGLVTAFDLRKLGQHLVTIEYTDT